MSNLFSQDLLIPLLGLFTVLFIMVLAARQMGDIFARFNLPLISGFLFVGILVGPFVLDVVHTDNIPRLLFLDELALAFIAFAAGAELERHVIQGYFRSIVALIGWQVVVILAFGVAAFMFLAGSIPFMAALPQAEILAVALLGATIMIARSPSSAIAVIKELRARGPFTHKVMGSTVLMDAVVIVIFAAAVSFAAVLVEGAGFDIGLLIFVMFEIALDIVLGLIIGVLLRAIMTLPYDWLKSGLILLLGLAVFQLSTVLHDFHLFALPVGLVSEPLLICMTAGFFVINYSRDASAFQHTLERMSPAIFLLFFTLVGIELELDVLLQAWGIVLFLFAVRLVAIFLGSFAGVTFPRDNGPGKALLGLGFITQAGVSIGLAREIAVEFPAWGSELATLSIGVIVLNQIVGPPLLKFAINRVGESHTRHDKPEFDGVRDALIFGIESQSLALARQLESHDWNVKLVAREQEVLDNMNGGPAHVEWMPDISVGALRSLETEHADAVVLLLSDEENYRICELIYEEFGIDNVIVRLQDRKNFEKLHELGALVVEPVTAMVTLLDQFVRSPLAATLLLGMDPDEEFLEVEMCNPELEGLTIREFHFPHDVLVLAVFRKGHWLVTHGYTRLELGDHLTLVGSHDGLREMRVKLEV